MNQDICTVTIRFSRNKGAAMRLYLAERGCASPTISEIEDWIKDCLNGLDPRNNSLTYHKPYITKVEIVN